MNAIPYLIAIGVYYAMTNEKKQVDKFPNDVYASPHFKWIEVLKSAGRPTQAAAARAKYPGGSWPKILTPELWNPAPDQRRYEYSDAINFAAKLYPQLTAGTIADNMVRHLTNLIEPMRADLGRPLTINSGWRLPNMNQGSGQATMSGHLFGVATDISAPTVQERAEIRDWLIKRWKEKHDIGYVGFYTWGVHVGSPRWTGDVPRNLGIKL